MIILDDEQLLKDAENIRMRRKELDLAARQLIKSLADIASDIELDYEHWWDRVKEKYQLSKATGYSFHVETKEITESTKRSG